MSEVFPRCSAMTKNGTQCQHSAALSLDGLCGTHSLVGARPAVTCPVFIDRGQRAGEQCGLPVRPGETCCRNHQPPVPSPPGWELTLRAANVILVGPFEVGDTFGVTGRWEITASRPAAKGGIKYVAQPTEVVLDRKPQ